ncbi:MAG TPA: nitrite reductase small subunit NirD [Polyangiaceae bacterium]|nr:nitrite reductase small subunit NirD [Polyangiaceae bacterium]
MLAISDETRTLPLMTADWIDVCAVEDILVGTGVAALVRGHQVAIFRPTAEGPIYALSNFDPFSHAFVIARGILGDKGGVLKVASPIFKQNFALATGQCLDDPSVSLESYPVRVVSGRVTIQISRDSSPPESGARS